MADGTSKPIEDVEVGDAVLAYDTKTGTPVASKVTQTFVHEEWKDRATTVLINGTLRATGNHLFYVNGKWTRADQIAVGDKLVYATPGTDGESELRAAPPTGLVAAAMGLADGGTGPTMADGMLQIDVASVQAMAGLDTVFNLEVADQHNYFTDGVLVHNLYEVECY